MCRWLAVLQKVKCRITIWPTIPFQVYTRRNWKQVVKYLHTKVYISCIHGSHKMLWTQMSINWYLDKQNVLYPFNGILLAIKRNKVLIHNIPWINLKNSKLSEKSQTQKVIYYRIPLFIWNILSRQINRDRKSIRVLARV